MRRSESEYEFMRLMNLKWGLLFVDVFVFIAALANFGICLWIRFDLDFKHWVKEMDWYSYFYCTYVVMIAMVVVVLTTGLQFYGIMAESRSALGSSIFFFVIAWILDLAGAVCIIVYGVEDSNTLTNQLRRVFLDLIYRMDYDPGASRILKIVQEYVECCGANGSEDYIGAYKPVPYECRDMVKGGEFLYGCAQQMAWWLEPWTATLAGVCVAFLVLHIVQIALAHRVMKSIRDYQRASYEDEDGYGYK